MPVEVPGLYRPLGCPGVLLELIAQWTGPDLIEKSVMNLKTVGG
jgi:hypothetical protein